MDNNYGFDSTDSVQYDRTGFPVGLYRVVAKQEEGVPSGVKVLFEILSGEYKGQTCSVYYNTKSENDITARIAQQSLKRIADVTHKPISPSTPLTGRVFCVDVIESKDARYTNVKTYHENSFLPAEAAPKGYTKPKDDGSKVELPNDSVPF